MPEPIIRIEHVSKAYSGANPVEALQDVNLTIKKGELVALIGPSGCGKTTLLKWECDFAFRSNWTYRL